MAIVDVGDVRLNCEVSGQQRGKTLVLMHSLGSNLHMWDKVMPAFERSFQVIRIDIRGHGQSSVAQDPFTIEDLGRDVLAVMDAAGLKRANVCGLSLGGLVALWLGVHAPERVEKLVLANTAARIGSREGWEQRITDVEAGGVAPLAGGMLERWFTPGYRAKHPDEMEQVRAMVAATNAEGYVACCKVLSETDLREQVQDMRNAALIIAGTHDPATPPSDGRAIHAAIQGSKYVEFDCLHLSAWEMSDEFAAEVIEYLAGSERGNG